jgi:hypothetical protein
MKIKYGTLSKGDKLEVIKKAEVRVSTAVTVTKSDRVKQNVLPTSPFK